MILTEMIDGRIRHYSDDGRKIRQLETGNLYEDAVDVIPCIYNYEETDEYIEETEDIEDSEALRIIMGDQNIWQIEEQEP